MSIAYILLKLISVVRILIIVRIVLSWVMPHRNEFTQLVYDVTEPMLKPFRVILPLGHMHMDLAPIIVFFLLSFLDRLVYMIF